MYTKTLGEWNFIVNDQNVSGKNFRFLSLVDSKKVVCPHVNIFTYCYHRVMLLLPPRTILVDLLFIYRKGRGRGKSKVSVSVRMTWFPDQDSPSIKQAKL